MFYKERKCFERHKLQGCTLDYLFVHTWNYSTIWVYVVLSRVRTMDNLYFREELHKKMRRLNYQKDKHGCKLS